MRREYLKKKKKKPSCVCDMMSSKKQETKLEGHYKKGNFFNMEQHIDPSRQRKAII